MHKINKQKLLKIEINFSKLHRIVTTYTYTRQSNRFKRFITFVYLPIHYSLTQNNTTNFGVSLTVRCTVWSGRATGS